MIRQVGQHGCKGSIFGGKTREERGQGILLGLGHRGERIKRGEDESLFLLGQLDIGHRNGRLVAGQSKVDPQVAIDYVAGRAVDQNLSHPADLTEGTREGALLPGRMSPPVGRVGD